MLSCWEWDRGLPAAAAPVATAAPAMVTAAAPAAMATPMVIAENVAHATAAGTLRYKK